MELTNLLWLMMVAVGPALLAGVLAFVLLKRNHAGPAERRGRERDAATRRAYDADRPATGSGRR